MAITLFKSWRSTVTPFVSGEILSRLRLLVDPTTGAPTGVQSPNANGPDGIWTPVDVTADQVASPTAGMLADLNSVYRLNVAPYTRYRSTGTGLVSLDGNSNIVNNQIIYSPWTITDPAGVNVQAEVHVISFAP